MKRVYVEVEGEMNSKRATDVDAHVSSPAYGAEQLGKGHLFIRNVAYWIVLYFTLLYSALLLQ